MKRGNLVTIVMQGDCGKPRPALVIQADEYSEHTSVTILPVTSRIVDAPLLRVELHPNDTNGLTKHSQVMIDKTMTVRQDKIGRVFGSIDAETLLEIERRLAVFLGIAK